MKKLTKSEIISKLPAYIVEEAKMHLRYGVPSHVIRRNGRLEVVFSLRSGYHTDDERFVCTITASDVFTETEQIENYINLYHKYPANYHGIRDEAVIARLEEDMTKKRGRLSCRMAKWKGQTSCTSHKRQAYALVYETCKCIKK